MRHFRQFFITFNTAYLSSNHFSLKKIFLHIKHLKEKCIFTPWFDKHFIQEKDNKILRLRLEKGSIRIFSFHLFLSVDNIAMLGDNIQARDQSANKLYLIISTLIVYKDHDGLYDGVSFYPNIELILTRR